MRDRKETDLRVKNGGLYARHIHDRVDVYVCPKRVAGLLFRKRPMPHNGLQDDEMHVDGEAPQIIKHRK